MKKDIERRCFSIDNVSLRVDSVQEGDRILLGRAIVYNKESKIIYENDKKFREIIMPGALTEFLSTEEDVRALWMHDNKELLGRRKSGTLAMVEDNDGVMISLKLPDTNRGNDIYELAKRGDINSMSFAFSIGNPENEEWSRETGGVPLRTLRKIPHVYDVSFVTDPAYADTTVNVRGLEELDKSSKEQEIIPNDDWKIEIERDKEFIDLIKIK